jgi:hypothetical protein
MRRRAETSSAVDESVALHQRGLASNKAGDTRGALRLFLQAKDLEPQKVPYLLSAANMYLKLEEAGPALELYLKIEALPMSAVQTAMVKEKVEAARAILAKAEVAARGGARARAVSEGGALRAGAAPLVAPAAQAAAKPAAAIPANGAATPPPAKSPLAQQPGAAPDASYTLEGLVGRGSFGVVWRGSHPSHGLVAVKIVPTDVDPTVPDDGDIHGELERAGTLHGTLQRDPTLHRTLHGTPPFTGPFTGPHPSRHPHPPHGTPPQASSRTRSSCCSAPPTATSSLSTTPSTTQPRLRYAPSWDPTHHGTLPPPRQGCGTTCLRLWEPTTLQAWDPTTPTRL